MLFMQTPTGEKIQNGTSDTHSMFFKENDGDLASSNTHQQLADKTLSTNNFIHQDGPHFDGLSLRYLDPGIANFHLSDFNEFPQVLANLPRYTGLENAHLNQEEPFSVDMMGVTNPTHFSEEMHLDQSSSLEVWKQSRAEMMKNAPTYFQSHSKRSDQDSRLDLKYDTTVVVNKLPPLVRNPQEAYLGLIPLINKTTPGNSGELLVATLRLCLHQVPLDDFYNLLFNDVTPDMVKLDPATGIQVDKSQCMHFKREGLTLCYYVLETLRLPAVVLGSFAVGLVNNPQLLKLKFDEIRRKFLAIKIILDSVIEIDGPSHASASLLRPSIRQAYNIICQKLSKNYPALIERAIKTHDCMVSLIELGRITNLVHPNLNLRRLGRRGESQYHYLGITWNKAIIDDELGRFVELQVKKRTITPNKTEKHMSEHVITNQRNQNLEVGKPGILDSGICLTNSFKPWKHVLYSFIDASSKYPNADCSLRSWDFIAGKLPLQSIWSKKVMLKSIEVLKKYDIDIQSLIKSFETSVFLSEYLVHFINAFIGAMRILLGRSALENDYLHLYLVTLLLISPVILASEKEIARNAKGQVRETLNTFVSRLHFEAANLPICGPHYLNNFTNIVRKMIQINETALTHIKTSLIEHVTKEVVSDVNRPAEGRLGTYSLPSLNEEIVYRAVLKAANAFNCKFNNDEQGNIELLKITSKFNEFLLVLTDFVGRIPESMNSESLAQSTYDLAFQLFLTVVQVFQQVCLSNPSVLQIPIQAIKLIMHQIFTELQNLSFHEFGKRNPELSKETFKMWWVCTTIIQEYVNLLSEITALAGRLAT